MQARYAMPVSINEAEKQLFDEIKRQSENKLTNREIFIAGLEAYKEKIQNRNNLLSEFLLEKGLTHKK